MTRWKLFGSATVVVLWALGTMSAHAEWEFSGWTAADGGIEHVFTSSQGKAASFQIADFAVSVTPLTSNTSVASVVLCNNGDQLPGAVSNTHSVTPRCPDGSAWGGAWVYE